MKNLALFILIFLTVFLLNAQNLVTYDVTPEIEASLHNNDFSVKVREPNGNWKDLFEYIVKVDKVEGTGHSAQNASMAYFDFSGTVEVAVAYDKGAVDSARVRPLSYNIQPEIEGNTLLFKLDKPVNLSIEINGDIFHNLHLFANPIQTYVPNKTDENVIYFGPGLHEIPNQKLQVPSNKTVYLAGGAILKGQIALDSVSNVNIIGRGMVHQDVRLGIHIANSKNIKVEGVMASQCLTGGSNHVEIKNVKTISYFGWGDGMNVMASNNVLFDGVFIRSSDDCTTVYGTRKGFKGGCSNITMKNATLWADVAHPILIGTHGNSEHPEILQNLSYINIDILDHKEKQIDYQGCMSINAGDNNLVKNVLFGRIRVEDFREGQLLNLRVFYNSKYCTAPGLGIENVRFCDVEYNGSRANLSIISGYNGERKIKNVTFENLKINGKTIYDSMEDKPKWYKTSDMAGIFVGEHVEDIYFLK